MITLRFEDVNALKWAGVKLLAAAICLRLLEWLFASRPLVAVVVGALLLDMWSQRLHARWSPSEGPASSTRSGWRALGAVGLGVVLGWVVLGAAALTGKAIVSWGHWNALGFVVAAFRTAAYALRDELLLRGIPLALTQGRVPKHWAVAFSTLLGIAPVVTAPGVRIEALLLVASMGLLLALVWQDGPGGLVAWGIHGGWRFGVQVVAQGAVLDVTWSSGSPFAGTPAYLSTCLFALGSFILLRWPRAAPE